MWPYVAIKILWSFLLFSYLFDLMLVKWALIMINSPLLRKFWEFLGDFSLVTYPGMYSLESRFTMELPVLISFIIYGLFLSNLLLQFYA